MPHAELRVDHLLHRLAASPLVSDSRPLVGADVSEVDELERHLGFTLPSSYRAFLLRAGRQAGTFMDGSDFALVDLLDLQEAAREIMEEVGSSLPPEGFIFLMHQGYEFLFFAHSREDAPVFRADDRGELTEVAPSFVHWLELAIEDELVGLRR